MYAFGILEAESSHQKTIQLLRIYADKGVAQVNGFLNRLVSQDLNAMDREHIRDIYFPDPSRRQMLSGLGATVLLGGVTSLFKFGTEAEKARQAQNPTEKKEHEKQATKYVGIAIAAVSIGALLEMAKKAVGKLQHSKIERSDEFVGTIRELVASTAPMLEAIAQDMQVRKEARAI